jgi:uncharacterized protein YcfJ
MTVGIVIVGSAVVWVTTVGIVVGTAVGTVVGGGVGTAVCSVVGSVTGKVVFPPITSADTGMVQITQSTRIMSIKKNRCFTVSLPVL